MKTKLVTESLNEFFGRKKSKKVHPGMNKDSEYVHNDIAENILSSISKILPNEIEELPGDEDSDGYEFQLNGHKIKIEQVYYPDHFYLHIDDVNLDVSTSLSEKIYDMIDTEISKEHSYKEEQLNKEKQEKINKFRKSFSK